MIGASTLVADLVPQRDSYVQIAGRALVIMRSDLLRAMRSSEMLRTYLLRYVQTQIAQMSLTVSASVRANVQTRLARKLLMYHDRVGVDELPLTHENMSLMFGAQASPTRSTALRARDGSARSGGSLPFGTGRGLRLIAAHFTGLQSGDTTRS
jgi:CRP-like cAMP-binding protein